MKFKIAPEIFAQWPEVKIGVVAVVGANNQKGTEADKEILAFLREQEKKIPTIVGETPVGQLPKITSWRQVYKDFGVTGNKYRSSVEALLKRAKAGNPLPDINPLVNLYNALSLKHQLPFGGEDLDKTQGDIELKICDGSEKGVYIGSQEEVNCEPGEVAYCDDLGFICRRWNWREAERTKLDPTTQAAVLVAEAMPSATEEELKTAIEEMAQILVQKLSAQVQMAILTKNKPELEIKYQPKEVKKTKETKEIKKKPDIKAKKAPLGKLPPLLQKPFAVGLEAQVLEEVKKAVKAAGLVSPEAGFDDSQVKLEHPANLDHGDYSTNIALILFSKKGQFKSPLDLANKLKSQISNLKSPLIEKVETAPPGFINIWLKNEALINQLREVLKAKDNYGNNDFLKDKRFLLEHTSPDPIKTIHIGHLRNNFLGMAMRGIFEASGAQITLDCINNDRGTHVSRAMFGYLVFARKNLDLSQESLLNFQVADEQIKAIAQKSNWRQLLDEWLSVPHDWHQPQDLGLKSDHLDLIFYSLGDRSERLVEGVKEQVREILRDWEEEKVKVRALWRQIIDWSLAGYKETYTRIGSHHDKVWHESDLYQGGKALVEQGLQKGVFKRSQGAVVTDLAAYGLPDTVVIKSDGTAVYHTFDIYFTSQKRQVFPSDLYIWDIGNDQILYLRQLFAMCEQLGIGKREDYYHLNYGYVYLQGGQRMSSRKGTVITADELLDFMKKKAREIMKSNDFTPEQLDQTAEKVALGALKYGLLKTSRNSDIHFDPETSIALSGNSGPYLQYALVRCLSVLKKAIDQKIVFSVSEYDLFRGKLAQVGRGPGLGPAGFPIPAGISPLPSIPQAGGQKAAGFPMPKPFPGKSPPSDRPKEPSVSKFEFTLKSEEANLLRTIYQYPEVVLKASRRVEPALICNFLFDLAQKFSLFYDRHSILGADGKDTRFFRLALTAAVAQILQNGLCLLGIEPLDKM